MSNFSAREQPPAATRNAAPLNVIAGTPIARPEDWARTAAGLAPGSQVDLVFESRGQRRTARVTVAKDPRVSIAAMAQPTPRQLALRDGWLKSRR